MASWISRALRSAPKLTPPRLLSKGSSWKLFPVAITRKLNTEAIESDGLKVRANEDVLELRWENGDLSKYPHIFLRDNCHCKKCYHSSIKQRLVDTVFNVDLNIKPKSVSSCDGEVNLLWEDGHESSYSYEWLRERKLPKVESEAKSRSNCGLEPILWGGELEGNIPEHDFEAVIKDESAYLSWLESIATTGLTLIKNAPAEMGIIKRISNNMGSLIRNTHYGEVWSVKRKPLESANNLAYTANYLPLHTDLPYYKYQPGIQLLHCVSQAENEGGENHFVDGFQIAEELRNSKPEAFEVLSTVKFLFEDIGVDLHGEYDTQFERPVIGLNNFGRVESIAHNNHVRSSFINAPAETVKRAYAAYYELVKTMYDPRNLVTHKLQPGEIITFNNQRVLHGRAAYEVTAPRHLEGCYFDWDEVYSRIRVLRKNLGIEQTY